MLYIWSVKTHKEEGGGAKGGGEGAGGWEEVEERRFGEASESKGKTWNSQNNMASRSSFCCSRSLEIKMPKPLSCES